MCIRTRDDWCCQRCGHPFSKEDKQGLDASHYFGRTKERTRFDPENVTAYCTGCHFYLDNAGKEEYREIKIKQLGQEGFDALRIRSELYMKKDRSMRLFEATEWLKILEEENEEKTAP